MIAVTMRFTVLMSHMWDGFEFASSAGLSLVDGRNDNVPIDGQGQSPRFDEQRAPLKLRGCSPLEASRFLGAASMFMFVMCGARKARSGSWVAAILRSPAAMPEDIVRHCKATSG